MTSVREALVGIGIAATGLGLVFAFRPDLAASLSLPQLSIAFLGLLALVQGARSVQTRRQSTIQGAVPNDTEERIETPRPGDDFDERVASIATKQRYGYAGGEARRIRERLRDAATTAVVARDGVNRATAEERVLRGTWTDDPVAGSFLGGDHVPDPPLRIRLRARFGMTPYYEVFATRTADAVAEAWGDR